MLTQQPKVYSGEIDVRDSLLYFPTDAPDLLRPGVTFTLLNSFYNTNSEYRVSPIDNFDLTPGKVYIVSNQVMWNGESYDCIKDYTQSSPLPVSSENRNGFTPYLTDEEIEVTPDNTDYWQVSKFIPVDGTLVNEKIFNGVINLNSNIVKFSEPFSETSVVTLSKFYENYNEDFSNLGVDLTYVSGILTSDLKYSSKYATVDFYLKGINGDLTKVSNQVLDYEKVIEVEEVLNYEENRDISERLSSEIVFTDLDEYGMVLTINGMPYQVDTVFYYNGANIDLEKTIDKTLRNWKDDHLDKLLPLGIIPDLEYSGYDNSPYVNSINLSTTFPNVELDYRVSVGTTANYYIERYDYIISIILGVLNVTVNGVLYTEEYSGSVSNTLDNFVSNYSQFILQ